MKKQPVLLFKLRSIDVSDLPVTSLERKDYPLVGDVLTLFNYPVVQQYRVERLDQRPEHFPHDWFEPVALILRPLGVILEGEPESNVVALNPGEDLPARLANVARIARRSITERLELEISHADFVRLCAAAGLPADVTRYDMFAYDGIPATVGEVEGEWNASTAFTGYSDDQHILYVTLPGGAPFVMNMQFRALMQNYWDGRVDGGDLLEAIIEIAVASGGVVTEGIQYIFSDMVKTIREGLLPSYDAAQELTRAIMPSEQPRLESRWQAHKKRLNEEGGAVRPEPNLTLEDVLAAFTHVPANEA